MFHTNFFSGYSFMERGEKKAYLNHSQHQKSENDNFCHFFLQI